MALRNGYEVDKRDDCMQTPFEFRKHEKLKYRVYQRNVRLNGPVVHMSQIPEVYLIIIKI